MKYLCLGEIVIDPNPIVNKIFTLIHKIDIFMF